MSNSNRPELGELTVGQNVIVVRSPNDSRRSEPGDRFIPARITKMSQVWIEMTKLDVPERSIYRWRMRRDTQDEGTQYSGNNASFRTLEQHAWAETRDRALGVLRENGITVEPGSPWRDREVALADIIVKGSSNDA